MRFKVSIFIFIMFFIQMVGQTEESLILKVQENGFRGTFFAPKNGTNLPIIVVVGGSGGGIESAISYAKELVDEGFAVLALAYFKMEFLPKKLRLIPLEYFETALKWIKSNKRIDSNRIGIMGTSKGGELALLLGSRYKEFKAVAALVPSGCVFQCIGGASPASSWSYKGKGLEFVPYLYPTDVKCGPGNWTPLYVSSLTNKKAVKKATIKVEEINGPIILFSGGKDKIWPSVTLCNMVVDRLKIKNFKHSYEHVTDKNFGHSIGRTMKYKWKEFFNKYLK